MPRQNRQKNRFCLRETQRVVGTSCRSFVWVLPDKVSLHYTGVTPERVPCYVAEVFTAARMLFGARPAGSYLAGAVHYQITQ